MSTLQINDLINPARLRLGIKRAFTGDIHEILSEAFQIYRSPARRYQGLLDITIDGMVVNTSVQEDAMPSIPLIETTYQNNRLVSGCPQIFYKVGQWGLGTEHEPPAEWRGINNHVVFAFNDPNNWDIDKVDFTVGGANPQDFYQTDAWAGFDPSNDQGRSFDSVKRHLDLVIIGMITTKIYESSFCAGCLFGNSAPGSINGGSRCC